MRKLWLIAKHEYLTRVRQRSFLISTLWVPFILVLVSVVGFLVAVGGGDDLPLGYVDQSGVLVPDAKPADSVEFRAFPDESSARSALESREIQAYYVIPADYLETRAVSLYYWDESPGEGVREDFQTFLLASAVHDLPEATQQRAMQGMKVVARLADGGRQINYANPLSIALPFVLAFFFMFAVSSSSGYLLQAIAGEKENRTIEVMVTSVSPRQLVGGKVLGLIGVSLTQLGIWLITIIIGMFVGGRLFFEVGRLELPWSLLLMVLLYFLPTYVLVAGLMTTIGGIVTDVRQGQQLAGIVNLLFIFPVFVGSVVIANPDHPILLVTTFFPTTALITLAMRWPFTLIPVWQIAVSWLILMLCAMGSIWMSARVFQLGMLRYGQRLSMRAVWSVLRDKA